MKVSEQELTAYLDGELEGDEAARMVLAVAADPELMRKVGKYRARRTKAGPQPALSLELDSAVLPPALPGPRKQPEPGRRGKARVSKASFPREGGAERRPPSPVRLDNGRRWTRLVGPVIAALLALTLVLLLQNGSNFIAQLF